MRLLHKEEPCPELFDHYRETLLNLQQTDAEAALRRFEYGLLQALGYGLVLDFDVTGHAIQPERWYLYEADTGMLPLPEVPREPARARLCFRGEHLLEIHHQQYEDTDVRAAAKRLSRLALAPHLGDKPLKSRELFAAFQQETRRPT